MKRLLLCGLVAAAPLFAGCHRHVYVREAYYTPEPCRRVIVDPCPAPVVFEESYTCGPRVVVAPAPIYVPRPYFGWGWYGPRWVVRGHCR